MSEEMYPQELIDEYYNAIQELHEALNDKDQQITDLQHEKEIIQKAFELACDPRDDWGGEKYSGTEFNNYHDYFIAEAEQKLAEIKGE